MSVPKLRFKEYKNCWTLKKLGDISDKIGSGNTPKGGNINYLVSGIPFIRSQNVNFDRLLTDDLVYISDEKNNQMKNSQIFPNDILLNITGASIGRSCVVPKSLKIGNVNQHVCIIRIVDNFSPYFLQLFLSSPKGQRLILSSQAGGGREGLNFQNIRSFKICFPSLCEQTKIADFLTTLDTRINQQEKQCQLLEQYKKGIMQQIFSQQLRFKDDNGEDFPEWQNITLGVISKKVISKNKDMAVKIVLTNSAIKGVVRQEDFFDREIVSDDNLNNYFIINKDDFVYNPRISINAPVGPINRNKFDVGIMSPLYTVLRFNNGNLTFLENYFQTNHWHNYMKSVANSGARHDRMNITDSDFFNLPIPFPTLLEQTKIANFLTAIDNKINLAKTQLEQLNTYKKGLLQQLFI